MTTTFSGIEHRLSNQILHKSPNSCCVYGASLNLKSKTLFMVFLIKQSESTPCSPSLKHTMASYPFLTLQMTHMYIHYWLIGHHQNRVTLQGVSGKRRRREENMIKMCSIFYLKIYITTHTHL